MIAVVGMHRSGTSLISNLLMDLGVPFGDPSGFLGANQWNPRGYYEATDVLDLNSRVITGFPASQGGLRHKISQVIYATRPGERAIRRRFDARRAEVERLHEKYRGVAVKDPRLCLTFVMWHEVRSLERVVLCLRHPLAAAQSLERRQSFPVRMGFRFWDWHMQSVLDGMSALAAVPTLWVDYDRLASDAVDAELDAVVRFFDLDVSNERAREVHGEVFDPKLRHFEPPDDAAMPPRTRAIWEELRRRRDAATAPA